MRVKDLISRLSNFDKDAEIYVKVKPWLYTIEDNGIKTNTFPHPHSDSVSKKPFVEIEVE